MQLESQPVTGTSLSTTSDQTPPADEQPTDPEPTAPVTAFAEPSEETAGERSAGPAPAIATSTPAASHDIAPPSRLEQLMATGWDTPAELPIEVEPVAARAADRRRKLSALFPADTLVVPSGR